LVTVGCLASMVLASLLMLKLSLPDRLATV
jgi:hypothetical protein